MSFVLNFYFISLKNNFSDYKDIIKIANLIQKRALFFKTTLLHLSFVELFSYLIICFRYQTNLLP